MKKIAFILLTFFYFHNIYAQETVFSTPNSAFIYSNPAFSGSSKHFRFNNIYKNQFATLPGNYNTNFLSIDTDYKGHGIGGYFLLDEAGTSSFSKFEIAGIYSQRIKLNDELVLSYALNAGIIQRRINLSNAIFEDQLNSDYSLSEISQETFSNKASFNVNIHSGVLIYGSRFWFGLSAHNLNKPRFNLIEDIISQRKLSSQLGYVYFLNNKRIVNYNTEKKNQVIYTTEVIWQGNKIRTSLAAKLFYNNIVANLSFSNITFEKRHLKAITSGIGYNFEMFTFNYNFEFYLSNISGIGGAHEIQVNLKLKNNNRSELTLLNKKSIKTFCPLK